MPVLVLGADTSLGAALMETLTERDGEIRAFVSDATVGLALKQRGVKVAMGDVSDASHVGAAAIGCFSIVALTEATHDARERAFASTPDAVSEAWLEAIADAGVQRVIWVGPLAGHISADEVLTLAQDTDVVRQASVIAAAEDAADWSTVNGTG